MPGKALVYFVASTTLWRWPLLKRAEGRFAGPVRVDIGGVDEIAPSLAERMDFAFAIPSIKAGSETNYRFAGVFHALNQRRARLCC